MIIELTVDSVTDCITSTDHHHHHHHHHQIYFCKIRSSAVTEKLRDSPPHWRMRSYLFVGCLKRTSIFSARQHAERAIGPMLSPVRPSVCLSVHPSHGWISRKRLKLGSCDFHHTVAPSLCFLRGKFHLEIPTGSPERGRQTMVGCGFAGNKLFS